MQTFIVAVACALIISFLCSIFESVLLSISTAKVETLAHTGSRAGRLMRRFKQHIDVPIAAILIVNTIAHTIGAAVAGASYENVFDPGTLWIFSIVFTVAVLLFTEIIPKTLGVTHAERLATPVAYGIQTLIVVLRPLVAVTEKISTMLRGKSDAPSVSIEEIRILAQLGRSEGAMGAKTAGMIVGATRLTDLRAVDVMLPRGQVVFLSATMTTEDAIDRVRTSRHSRFPFSPTESIDQCSGIVLAKELLLQLQSAGTGPIDWNVLVREPIVVPESQPLNMLLRTFQDVHRHMALVVDEYGHYVGIVTIEDVLEEIVGDIIDESDLAQNEVKRNDDGSIELDASLDMRRLTTLLETRWSPGEKYHSINGLLSEQLGRLPVAGDAVVWNGYEIRVLTASERTADKVLIRQKSQQ